MELVEKGTLDSLIELQGQVAEAQVLEVAIQIASGLRAAHQAGLIHRDVKPGNILFADGHTAKIVDFGLAIFAEDEAKVRGEVWGTPYYVAPEKLDQKPEDFRSDIYSLGATLFHALAGRPPFEAENASLVALKHLKSQAVSLQAFAPHVSSNTAYVINRTLSKDPDQRYQSYDELIEHLEYARNELQAGRGKAGEKRVVLETAQQKQAMGWLSFIMIGFLVALIAAGVIFRKQFFSSGNGPEETSSTKGSALIAAGVNQLANGKAEEAITALGAVVAQKPPQPWLNWAEMLTGLSQFASGHRAEGMEIFQRIETRGLFSKKDADQPLANFFVHVSEQMTGEHMIDPKTVVSPGRESFAPSANLFYAMKDWEAGDVDDATEFFRRFRQGEYLGADAWLDQLKPLATDYIEQYTAYGMASDIWKKAKTIDQKRSAIAALKGVQGKLAPKAQELAKTATEDLNKALKERSQALAQGKVPDGRYKLTNRKTGKTIEVEGHSKDDGHKLQTNAFNNGGNQQWHIIPKESGSYALVSIESGKAINVPKGAPDDGLALQQGNVNNSPPQKWKIEKTDGGFFKLTSMASSKVLAVGGDGNAAPIVQVADTGAPEQQWKIEGL
jgi:prepilin-type processing-associated H-X9-DG protein